MLTQADLEQVKIITRDAVKEAFQDFDANIFESFATRNQSGHLRLMQEII